MRLVFLPLTSLLFAGRAETPNKAGRTLQEFDVIRTEQLTVAQILDRFGRPDRDIGSGIFVFEYDLKDGRKVRISTADQKTLIAATVYDPRTKKSDLIYK